MECNNLAITISGGNLFGATTSHVRKTGDQKAFLPCTNKAPPSGSRTLKSKLAGVAYNQKAVMAQSANTIQDVMLARVSSPAVPACGILLGRAAHWSLRMVNDVCEKNMPNPKYYHLLSRHAYNTKSAPSTKLQIRAQRAHSFLVTSVQYHNLLVSSRANSAYLQSATHSDGFHTLQQ